MTEEVISTRPLSGGRIRVELPSGIFVVPGKGAPALGEQVSPASLANRQKHSAMAAAQRFLALAERSTGQLAARLEAFGYPRNTAEEVVSWAQEQSYVNDLRFARIFIRSRSMGASRLRLELSRRGVERKAIDEVLKGYSQEDLFDAAVAEVRKRYGGIQDEDKARRRAHGWLARRGYEGDFIRRVLGAAL